MSVLIILIPIAIAEEYRIDYDQNGNIIYDQESNVYREYNELNQLIRTRLNNISGTILQEYTYDPLQERIFIKDEFYSNGTLKSSTYYFDDDYVVIQNSSGTFNETYIFQDGILVGYEDTDGKKRYVLPDHEGSAHIVLDENGNVLEENLFSPFAEPLEGVKESRFSYEAREYDDLVQDYDFHFRKYNPNIRIFMQPDTLIQNVYDPQSLNRYSFERNNPVRHTDPTGHILPLMFWIGIAFIVSATISGGILANQLSTVEQAEGSLSNTDVAMAFLNIGLIVFPTKSLLETPIQGVSQLGLKSSGILAYRGYFDKRIANLEKPEAKKVLTEEDLKCGLAVDCQLRAIEGQGQPQGTSSVSSSSPSTSQPSSQTNSASSANPKSSSASTGINGGEYVAGVGYVTPEGRIYPTNNPNWKPNPNAPRYTPPPPKPKSSKGGKK